ncbi:hypothetical protein VM1G_06304 [Cytospora mali]|uniref:Uncharacterized protein n=1 Tax=Cytospora mali TaxID=578113 RepID=A0A194W1P2_CYTMA|nr:hypothetical protein VM1G_06304 [Valsa mali]
MVRNHDGHNGLDPCFKCRPPDQPRQVRFYSELSPTPVKSCLNADCDAQSLSHQGRLGQNVPYDASHTNCTSDFDPDWDADAYVFIKQRSGLEINANHDGIVLVENTRETHVLHGYTATSGAPEEHLTPVSPLNVTAELYNDVTDIDNNSMPLDSCRSSSMRVLATTAGSTDQYQSAKRVDPPSSSISVRSSAYRKFPMSIMTSLEGGNPEPFPDIRCTIGQRVNCFAETSIGTENFHEDHMLQRRVWENTMTWEPKSEFSTLLVALALSFLKIISESEATRLHLWEAGIKAPLLQNMKAAFILPLLLQTVTVSATKIMSGRQEIDYGCLLEDPG